MQTVYIKTELCSVITNKRVKVSDVCQVYAYDADLAKLVRNLELYRIEQQGKQKISVSSLYLIRKIMDAIPGIVVENLGEADFIMEYRPHVQEKKWLEMLKTAMVGVIVFFGSAFTIITFNEDSNVAGIFQHIYSSVAGMSVGNGWLEVSYSIGLPVGILLFFNHFSTARLSNDPTPLQIQMRQYENQEDSTIIENAARKGDRLE